MLNLFSFVLDSKKGWKKWFTANNKAVECNMMKRSLPLHKDQFHSWVHISFLHSPLCKNFPLGGNRMTLNSISTVPNVHCTSAFQLIVHTTRLVCICFTVVQQRYNIVLHCMSGLHQNPFSIIPTVNWSCKSSWSHSMYSMRVHVGKSCMSCTYSVFRISRKWVKKLTVGGVFY